MGKTTVTDDALLAEANALDAAYADAARHDAARAAEADEDKLDAYGHLSWTVGNEDWIACFDARRVAEGIEYHTVVNCESGGFIDTLEHGTVPATEDGIRNLLCLPAYWAEICMEHYSARGDQARYGRITWRRTAKLWAKHIRSLLAEPAQEPAEPHDYEGEARERRP